MHNSKLFTYIEALFAVIVWGASFVATKMVKDDSSLAVCASCQSYASTTRATDSQHSQIFGTSSISKFSGRKYQNPITFTSRLSLAKVPFRRASSTRKPEPATS
jgi:hypothetical protein